MCVISELKEGSEIALEQLFDEYQHAVYYYVFDRTRSDYCSKEVVQLSFIKLWNSRHRLKENVHISYQLFRIARTTMIDEVRRIQRGREFLAIASPKELLEDVDETMSYNDTKKKLEQLVALMPRVRQRVFYLSRFNDYTHKEIAEMLSISPKTVENHINLAIKFIRPFFPVISYFTICF